MLLVTCCLLPGNFSFCVSGFFTPHLVPRTPHQDFLLDNPRKSHKCERKNSCNHQ